MARGRQCGVQLDAHAQAEPGDQQQERAHEGAITPGEIFLSLTGRLAVDGEAVELG